MTKRVTTKEKPTTGKPNIRPPSQSVRTAGGEYNEWMASEMEAQMGECLLQLDGLERCLERLRQFVKLHAPYPIMMADVNLLARRGQQFLQAYDILLQLRTEKTENRNAGEPSKHH